MRLLSFLLCTCLATFTAVGCAAPEAEDEATSDGQAAASAFPERARKERFEVMKKNFLAGEAEAFQVHAWFGGSNGEVRILRDELVKKFPAAVLTSVELEGPDDDNLELLFVDGVRKNRIVYFFEAIMGAGVYGLCETDLDGETLTACQSFAAPPR